ncbi:Protein F37C4.5 [Fasciola gigantica]|uniref:Protein F37C4.5 n=1 Tax=Fasciola gigantica TaxID=46835 RepID=A0A504YB12_FASGI|nr:Protein F37C4.5 [Fasciola gigantica]
MQSGAGKTQDTIVLNPQTGEILNSGSPPVQAIHLTPGVAVPTQLSKAEILMTSDGQPVVTGGSPVNGPTDGASPPGAGGYNYQSGGQPPTRSGVGGVGGIGAGGSSSGGQPVMSNSLERIRQVYKMSECQMAHLTVFMDRALVCRRIRPRFNACEITEVLFENLSPAIDKDSIR